MDEVSPHVLQSREKFQDFSFKFENYAKKYSPSISEELRDFFDEFISFVEEVPRDAVIYPDYDTVLNSLAAIVSTRSPDLTMKLCHCICCLLGKHNVRLTNHLNQKLLAVCLKGLNKRNSEDDNVLILKAVTLLLRADDNHLLVKNEFFHSLANPPNGFLLEFMSDKEANGQLLLAAVGCLELLLLPSSSLSSQDEPSESQQMTSEVSEACIMSVITVLGRGKPPQMYDLEYCKMVIASLRCLHHLLSPSATAPSPSPLAMPGRLGELIGVIRAFLGLGLPGVSDGIKYPVGPFKAQSSSAVQGPSQVLDDTKDSYKGRATKAMRKNRKKTAKKGAAVLVDSIEGEKLDMPLTHNRLCVSGGKATLQDSENSSPKLPHLNLTSDSELSSSDVESAGRIGDSEGRSAFSKVRQMACSLLLCLIQVTEPSILFSFWPSLLPDGVPTGPGHLLPSPLKVGEEVTLATLILRDPTSKGRALAAIVLASLLTSWQRFLIQAECSREKKTMSFTPFSIALGWSMCALHKNVCLAFSSERSTVSILRLLRCCTAMVLASSYHKLASGLLHRLVVTVRPLLKHRDPCVIGGVLSLYGAIASLDPTPPEVIQVFSRASSSKLLESVEATEIIGVPVSEATAHLDVPVDEEDCWDNEFYDDEEDPVRLGVVGGVEQSKNLSNQQEHKFSLDPMHSKGPLSVPWIIEVCLKPLSLKDRSASIPVQTECLQVLTSISKNQDLAPRLLFHQDFWQILQSRIVVGSGDVTDVADSFPLKFHWARFWESLGRTMKKSLDSSAESMLSLPQAVLYWQTLLSGMSMVSLIQDMDNPSLRAVGCDVLASIGAPIFGHLTRDKQILCETLLFGSSRDEEPSVKSAALRALGIYTLFPSLREDLHFLLDTFDTLQSALDSDPGRGEVWLSASWALANLCDALILNREEGIADELPEGPFLELLEASASAIQPLPKGGSSGDRVRFNGVRAAGSVIRLIDLRGWDEMAGNMSLFSLGKRGKEAAEKVAVALVDAATKSCDMKVRWNACYAISNMLKNNTLYENGAAYADLVTKAKVFPALCSLVRDFRNLKVRINAAVALSSPRLHSNYGQRNFLDAWKALLEGLDNSQRSGIDIAGHNHQQNLVDQIVLTMCHLAKLVERGDLAALGEIVDPYMEIAKAQVIRRSQTLVPEKASLIAEAESHLGMMRKNSVGEMVCWIKSEEEGLKKLIKLFSPEETIEYGDSYPF